jgi:hypothetical protein
VSHPGLTPDEVRERLGFAHRRKEELAALNGGDLAGADPHMRQQLVQEFFFHLVGAIEVLAQLVNEVRNLGLPVEDASAARVIDALPQGDSVRAALAGLYMNTRPGKPQPSNPYSDDGLMYRIWNYRHQVTHRRRQPFQLNVAIGTSIDFGPGVKGRLGELRSKPDPDAGATLPSAHFILDPRQAPGVRTASIRSVADELEDMLGLVSARCETVLALI